MQAWRNSSDPSSGTGTHDIEYDRPWLYPKQAAAIFCPERFAVIEASTKSGKTLGCIFWMLELAMSLKPGQCAWWVAPVAGQARIAYDRIKRYLPKQLYRSHDTDRTITLANGVPIWFKSGEKPDNLYGEDVHGVVVDEATRMRPEAWTALRTTITATLGRVRIIGNVKGRRNWAYALARKAEAGRPNWHYAKMTADDAVDAGILDAAEVKDAASDMPEDTYRELYFAEVADDAANPFKLEYIRACIHPIQPGPAKAFGWDLAKHVDWTVGIGLNKGGFTCNFERFQQPWKETAADIMRVTGKIDADVDSTGVGDPIVERLQREGGSNFYGYNFGGGRKQPLMEGLAVGIQSGEVHYPEGVISRELESFEYQYTRTGVKYSAPEGFNDDAVCALALAYHRWKQAGGSQFFF
ncbi:MAG: terminase family protein [Gammaproteobacteria bacterium]